MDSYIFHGVPITAAIAEELIIELFNGQTLKRDEIASKILDHHISNGGLHPESKNFDKAVQKALSNLKSKGHATNISSGFWNIQKNDAPITINEDISEEVPIEKIPTHKIYGKGKNAVYLYFFPTYKAFAEKEGKNSWPCKIGRTDRDPLIRILSQSSTALPEIPTIEYVIKTDNSSLLETMLHSILILRNQQLQDSPGVEWFLTNPEEVLSIVRFVNGQIL
jgi:hypothetical protein